MSASAATALALIGRIAAWPFRVAAARAALNALAAMDRRELADIGLTPCDLRDVSALALDRDPTALLAARAGERRRNAHGPASSGDERPRPSRATEREPEPTPTLAMSPAG